MASRTKEESLAILEKLDTKVLERLTSLSEHKKAMAFFKSPIKFGILKAKLNSL